VKMICDHANECKLRNANVCPASVAHDCRYHGGNDDFECEFIGRKIVRCVEYYPKKALAEQMEYYAGFSVELNWHAHEMAGASLIARGWAKAIRKGAK